MKELLMRNAVLAAAVAWGGLRAAAVTCYEYMTIRTSSCHVLTDYKPKSGLSIIVR